MVKAIKENEGGRSAKEMGRELGINKGTFYNWRKKYLGMEASQLKKLKELQEENRKPKQMYTELCLENVMLKDVIEKNGNTRRWKALCPKRDSNLLENYL